MTNVLQHTFPEVAETQPLSCTFEVNERIWPPVPGEYFTFIENSCSVAVSTLGSVELAHVLADMHPRGLCIAGKTETENIGIDKVIKNTITNPAIRFLVVAGDDPKGHYSGQTLLALSNHGVDASMRVIGSPGQRPVLRNVTREEVDAFRKQVQVIDMVGCEDVERIVERVEGLSLTPKPPYEESAENKPTSAAVVPTRISSAPVIRAYEPKRTEMDKAGYFVIIPQPEKEIITVEHYAHDNTLLHVIEGTNARDIYWTIIEGGRVSQLSHAAYLGKELGRAEFSIRSGLPYVQDGI